MAKFISSYKGNARCPPVCNSQRAHCTPSYRCWKSLPMAVLKLIHTATPDTTQTGLFCRVWLAVRIGQLVELNGRSQYSCVIASRWLSVVRFDMNCSWKEEGSRLAVICRVGTLGGPCLSPRARVCGMRSPCGLMAGCVLYHSRLTGANARANNVARR